METLAIGNSVPDSFSEAQILNERGEKVKMKTKAGMEWILNWEWNGIQKSKMETKYEYWMIGTEKENWKW